MGQQKFGAQVSDPNCINLTAGASYGVGNILTSVTSPKSPNGYLLLLLHIFDQ